MASSLPFPDYGLNTDDIHYFHMDSVVRGRGPDRLKYLDLEGRWKLSGKSIPYISAAFNHLQRLNDASVPMRNLERAPLNAIGMVTWNSSARVPEKPEKKELTILKPEVEIREVIPPSPREVVPHRSAGYGWAHQKRKLSIPDRSRSPSVSSRNGSPTPEFDKFAKYQRKDSTTTYGTRYGSHRDLGYISNEDRHSSGAPSPKDEATEHLERPPHRTQPLSPTPNAKVAHDSQYDPTYLSRDRQYADELTISVKDSSKYYSEKPIASYRDQYLRKTYELSPKSTGSTDYSSTSEQNSPNKKSPRTAEEYLLEAYHYKSTFRDEPRRSRMDWSPRY
ncbi:hypothetical protein L596_004600 [Steinernema carpocapsae]|uniref:Uncharacterized protein n=1 Tax=Steinernema carpocapsae TaxID=34508 RepID=A0A4U8UWA8_STECR|nr:hypothetical protein L596_004600 [Steinernema carpocapsae]